MPDSLFNQGELAAVMQARLGRVGDAVAMLASAELDSSAGGFEKVCGGSFLELVALDRGSAKPSQQRSGQGGVSLTYKVPYTGSTEILTRWASVVESSPLRGRVMGQEVLISRTFDASASADGIKQWASETLDTIERRVRFGNADAAAYNEAVKQAVRAAIGERVAAERRMAELQKDLGIGA
jgi:hypothetical protein